MSNTTSPSAAVAGGPGSGLGDQVKSSEAVKVGQFLLEDLPFDPMPVELGIKSHCLSCRQPGVEVAGYFRVHPMVVVRYEVCGKCAREATANGSTGDRVREKIRRRAAPFVLRFLSQQFSVGSRT
jgi:hypothetical protein